MKHTLTIFHKELKSYFNSSLAYIFIIVFLLISAGMFMNSFFILQRAEMREFFNLLPIYLCIFIPAICMRLWAEEKKQNTLELLLTFPMKTYQLVLGKFFASLVFYLIVLLSTSPLAIMVMALGNPDRGVLISQYLGSILMGGFLLACGIFISGLFKDQIVAFCLAMLASFSLFLVGTEWIASSLDGWIKGLGSFLKASLGIATRFFSFAKGVVDIKDILYFLLGTVIFLILNSLWLDRRLKPKTKANFTTTSTLSLAIFIVFNFLITDLNLGRFDLTEAKIYSLSPSSRKILKSLDAPVTAKLFISPAEKMPTGFKTLEQKIRDKLDEFKISSGGKFNYKVFHVEAANLGEEEDLASSLGKKGIKPFQVRSVELDEVGVKLIYSALSLAYRDKPEEVIPQIIPNNLDRLEYFIISKIYKMNLSQKPKIALVAPYEDKAVSPQLQQLLKNLGAQDTASFREDNYELLEPLLNYEGYEVSRIRLTRDEPISPDTKTLIIIEPKNINQRQKFEINKFLVKGGSLFLGIQKYNFNYHPFGLEGLKVSVRDNSPNLNSLLREWGIEVDSDILMDTQSEIISLGGGKLLGLFTVSSPVKLPVQIKILNNQMNQKLSLTSNLGTLLYLWGNALKIDEEKIKKLNLEKEILFTSSPSSWKIKYHSGFLTPQDITPPQKRDIFPLAVMVKGKFPDAFKDKDIPLWPDEEKDESVEREKETLEPKPAKLIVVGCATMFDKRLFTQSSHMNFFLNAIDALTLGEELIQIRSKADTERPLKRVSNQQKLFWRIFSVIFVPVIFSFMGITKLVGRRRAKIKT